MIKYSENRNYLLKMSGFKETLVMYYTSGKISINIKQNIP